MSQIKSFARTVWADMLFACFWTAILIGIFELFFDAWQRQLVMHPVWSTVFGKPILHHLYYFHFALMILWLIARKGWA